MNKLMRPKDWFTVGLRLLGVWMLLESLGELVSGLELQFRFIEPLRTTPFAYFLHTAIDFVAAVALLRCSVGLFWTEPDFEDARFEVIPLEKSSDNDGSK
jgi:hypothetical protein